jgi:hypothetical protein
MAVGLLLSRAPGPSNWRCRLAATASRNRHPPLSIRETEHQTAMMMIITTTKMA